MKYVTTGNYHMNMGRFDTLEDKPVYKNYGNFAKGDIDSVDMEYGLSIKEVCDIREKCGNHKYTYDKNYDLQDFCRVKGEDDLAMCIVSASCKNKTR